MKKIKFADGTILQATDDGALSFPGTLVRRAQIQLLFPADTMAIEDFAAFVSNRENTKKIVVEDSNDEKGTTISVYEKYCIVFSCGITFFEFPDPVDGSVNRERVLSCVLEQPTETEQLTEKAKTKSDYIAVCDYPEVFEMFEKSAIAYKLAKAYYPDEWNKEMLQNLVKKGRITSEQYDEIVGKEEEK